MKPSGNTVHVDNDLLSGGEYATGDNTFYVDLTHQGEALATGELDVNSVSIGAIPGAVGYSNYPVDGMFGFAYNGYVSDIIVYNRALHADEITKLYNNNIGYAVIVFAGQSNGAGRGAIRAGIDDDYLLHEGRVDSFNTYTNIDLDTYTVLSSEIVSASNPLEHPELDGQPNNNGAWRSLCNDIIQYSDIPYRMKVLIVPCCKGGSRIHEDWMPSQQYYEICASACNKVLGPDSSTTSKMNKLLCFIWNQGESNMSGNEINYNYAEYFSDMMDGFSTKIWQFNDTTTNIFLTEISGQYDTQNYDTGTEIVRMKPYINNLFKTIADSNDNMRYIRTNDLKFLVDNIHIDAQGQETLGHRYYDEMVDLLNIQSRKPNADTGLVIDSDKTVYVTKPMTFMPVAGLQNLEMSTFAKVALEVALEGPLIGDPVINFSFTVLGNVTFLLCKSFEFTTSDVQGDISVTLDNFDGRLAPADGGLYILAKAYKTTDGTSTTVDILCRFIGSGLMRFTGTAEIGGDFRLEVDSQYQIRPFTTSYVNMHG